MSNKQYTLFQGTNGVAFHASLSSAIDSPHNGHLMQFDNVLTNIGNGYNHNDGVFTCPQTGTYFITWSFRIERHQGSFFNFFIYNARY